MSTLSSLTLFLVLPGFVAIFVLFSLSKYEPKPKLETMDLKNGSHVFPRASEIIIHQVSFKGLFFWAETAGSGRCILYEVLIY